MGRREDYTHHGQEGRLYPPWEASMTVTHREASMTDTHTGRLEQEVYPPWEARAGGVPTMRLGGGVYTTMGLGGGVYTTLRG